jgi:hypothetical protein
MIPIRMLVRPPHSREHITFPPARSGATMSAMRVVGEFRFEYARDERE